MRLSCGFKFTFLLAHATLPAFLRAVLTVFAIFAGMTRVGTCAGRCGRVRWNLADEKNRQQDLSQNEEESWFEHCGVLRRRLGTKSEGSMC